MSGFVYLWDLDCNELVKPTCKAVDKRMSNQSVNIMLFMQLNTLVSTIKMNNFFVLKWNTLHQGNKGQALKFKLKKQHLRNSFQGIQFTHPLHNFLVLVGLLYKDWVHPSAVLD